MKLNFTDGQYDLPSSEKAATRFVADLFLNSGNVVGQDQEMDWHEMRQHMQRVHSDAVTTGEIRPLLAKSLDIVIREPVEPMAVLSSLFTKIRVQGLEHQVIAGAISGVTADDVPEHGPYPEVMINLGGGLESAYIGKSGLAASFTDEALRYSTWDIFSMVMREIGKALVRWKEYKAGRFISNLGTPLFDNATPTNSVFGVCTGRGLDMQGNGSITMDDLFKGIAFMTEQGFSPDLLIMHPMHFYIWQRDPVLRQMFINGVGGAWFNTWGGNPGPTDPWSRGSLGGRADSPGQIVSPYGNVGGETPNGMAGREYGMTSVPTIPMYGPGGLRIVTSPQMAFDATTGLGDIVIAQAGEIGYHMVDQDPQTVSWRDENVDVMKMKVMERYGYNVANEGMAIGLFKNVPTSQNFWNGIVEARTNDVDAEISPTATVLS